MRKLGSIFALVLLTFFLAAYAFAEPDPADIPKLEAAIKLEQLPGWSPRLPALSGYVRYYASSTRGGEKVILGELVIPSINRGQPGFHLVSSKRSFPLIYDGGCAVVNLVYSIQQQKVLSIQCNGVA